MKDRESSVCKISCMVFHLDVQFPVFSRQLVTKRNPRTIYRRIGEGRNKKQIGSSKTEVIDPKKRV